MLDLINSDREKTGLSRVVLGNNPAAQKHAEEGLEHDYSSHWGLGGMKPYMRYTLAGGFNYEAENGFMTRTIWPQGRGLSSLLYERDPKEMLEQAEKSLMGSEGHRRNILNEWHRKVNLGIAYDRERLRLVQDFEGDYIEFNKLPSLSNGLLSMVGKTSLGTIDAVALYYDPLPQPLTPEQLEAPPYDYSYSLGERAGSIISPPPPGRFYINLPPNSVQATRWAVTSDGSFAIAADINPLLKLGKGVYTVVIWAETDGESVDLTNYSIFVE